jgi:hypothetical protein
MVEVVAAAGEQARAQLDHDALVRQFRRFWFFTSSIHVIFKGGSYHYSTSYGRLNKTAVVVYSG